MSVPPQSPSGTSRWLPLEGTVNFRDLGGYSTADGRTVAWGRLYRADGLSRLTDADLGVLRDRALTTVIDLRTTHERELGSFPTDRMVVDLHHTPLLDALPDPDRFQMTPGMLGATYLEIIRDAAPQIGTALRILAVPGATPAVIHCAAGKDRTGVLAAVVLGVLGVSEDQIIADYVLSAQVMGEPLRLVQRYPEGREAIEAADEMFSAPPATMEALLDELRAAHGSIGGFAASVGAGPEVVSSLRDALLEG